MTDVSGATNLFPKAEENSVAMTLGGSILAGAATVPINGMTNYTDGDVIAFTVDPATPSLKQVFTGTKSGANIINAVWTEKPTGGANVAHAAGATVIDYVSATHWDLFQKGVTSSLNQDGSMKTTAVQTALNINSGATNGWTPTGFAPSAVAANGNRSYTLTFAATNLTTSLSPGMRLMTTRTVAAPTQCTSLNGTTQFYSKATPAGMTFTNNFVASGWVKLTSYPTSNAGVISRTDGASGFILYINTSGQVVLGGYSGAALGNNKQLNSYQSIPLNKWVHVAAQLDMSSTTNSPTVNYVMIDGLDVPAVQTSGGTAPTTLVQAGDLNVGAYHAGNFFPGSIAQVAIYSAKVTQANVLASISQGLAGTETSLISAYSFNNSFNDLNANANNLTANGSAVATATDSPFGGQAGGSISSTLDYGIITSASFSTNTTLVVQVPEGCTIPTTGGVSAVSYSTVAAPYGFPKQRGKWRLQTIFLDAGSDTAVSGGVSGTWYNPGSFQLNTPVGEWVHDYSIPVQANGTGASNINVYATLSTSSSSEANKRFTHQAGATNANNSFSQVFTAIDSTSVSTMTPYYGLIKITTSTVTTYVALANSVSTAIITAECAYL